MTIEQKKLALEAINDCFRTIKSSKTNLGAGAPVNMQIELQTLRGKSSRESLSPVGVKSELANSKTVQVEQSLRRCLKAENMSKKVLLVLHSDVDKMKPDLEQKAPEIRID